jgi:hypothetical protein
MLLLVINFYVLDKTKNNACLLNKLNLNMQLF